MENNKSVGELKQLGEAHRIMLTMKGKSFESKEQQEFIISKAIFS
jgi:hypothetical protein